MQNTYERPGRGTGSIVLDMLRAETREEVLRGSTHNLLTMGTALFRTDDSATHLYFISGGVVSLRRPLPDGSACEVATYGNAAAPGATALLGSTRHYSDCLMQSSGSAYRLRMNIARSLFERKQDFRNIILAFLRDHIRVEEVITACNARHPLEQRLARWLLSYSEMTGSDFVMLTHEHFAQVLAAQRVSISTVVSGLQRESLIKQSRGYLGIADRNGLEARACGCYAAWKQIYLQRHEEGLLPEI